MKTEAVCSSQMSEKAEHTKSVKPQKMTNI